MKTLIIAAHPDLGVSKANRALIDAVKGEQGIFVHDLYGEYPDWNIDVAREHRLLTEHDRIVLQFPFYWYSTPPLLKKWFDDVILSGWAYGPGGDRLKGKEFMVATTAGGTEKSFQAGGDNWYAMSEYLKPIQGTVNKCSGVFLPPFVVYDANRADGSRLRQEGQRYAEHIRMPYRVLVH